MELMDDLVKERFGADAARELCQKPGLFERGRVYRRIQISRKLRDEFVERGGDEKTTPEAVAVALKKWLVASDSPFSRVGRGRYRFAGVEASTGQMFDAGVVSEGSDAAYGEELTPQRELGTGPYEVYAWCLPQYQEASGDRWPIKIGRAGPDGLRRRVRDFQENLPERPRYLLRLRCADDREAKDRESFCTPGSGSADRSWTTCLAEIGSSPIRTRLQRPFEMSRTRSVRPATRVPTRSRPSSPRHSRTCRSRTGTGFPKTSPTASMTTCTGMNADEGRIR